MRAHAHIHTKHPPASPTNTATHTRLSPPLPASLILTFTPACTPPLTPPHSHAQEVLSFTRAVLPSLLRWEEPLSPTHGFHRAMVVCGVDPEDVATGMFEALLEVSAVY